MSFLEITYNDYFLNRNKEIRIISCEQICGKQIRVNMGENSLLRKMEDINKKNPKRYRINKGKNVFKVQSSNLIDITTTSNGTSHWFLVRAHKSSRKQINFLFLNQVLWGLEISSGLRIKKSCETYGPDKIVEYLESKVESIFSQPEEWAQIDIYCR
ncbi:MAG: hypothetical protein DRO88_09780 [Promethearchaeia archaeon]|nr:MAG: hypothetical protein DRO88_09780 [Candidatus Lokiarchaeia archaeon]